MAVWLPCPFAPYLLLLPDAAVQSAGKPSSNMLAEMFEAVMVSLMTGSHLNHIWLWHCGWA